MENKSKYSIEEIKEILLDYSRISQNIIQSKQMHDKGKTDIMSNYDMFAFLLLEEVINSMDDEELFDVIEKIRTKAMRATDFGSFYDGFFGTLKQIIKDTKKQ